MCELEFRDLNSQPVQHDIAVEQALLAHGVSRRDRTDTLSLCKPATAAASISAASTARPAPRLR
jgi:hypothetical protein